ncbi:hypothetical protein [Aurantiacibacter sediminis]|nr:hypothetical protein [Aurantiacibacter sediminis]
MVESLLEKSDPNVGEKGELDVGTWANLASGNRTYFMTTRRITSGDE